MDFCNVEIKAHCNESLKIRELLLQRKAKFVGTDFQKDTYFRVKKGKLKIREGEIENFVIYYERDEIRGLKKSDVSLINLDSHSNLSNVMKKAFDILAIVKKKREIYFIDNVKFHLDIIDGLGEFIEIEAKDEDMNLGIPFLEKQCQFYMELFKIEFKDLINKSYIDLISEKNNYTDNGSHISKEIFAFD
jgi:predicted adenylyl cyclase CyaB